VKYDIVFVPGLVRKSVDMYELDAIKLRDKSKGLKKEDTTGRLRVQEARFLTFWPEARFVVRRESNNILYNLPKAR